MSQQLTLELSDEVYAHLEQQANAQGLPLAEWIVAELSRQDHDFLQIMYSSENQDIARQRFKAHAGSISLGAPTGIDNESIDADLAQAYGNDAQNQ